MSVAQQLRGLKQELLCHRLARQQATLFNSRVTSFATGQVAKTPPYAALRSKPWGLQVTFFCCVLDTPPLRAALRKNEV